MKQYKGAVFFDYDGTLIDEVDGIFEMPDSTKQALTQLRKNGYAVCICSGRTKRFCEQVKDYFDGYVTAMGAHVEIDGNVIESVEIPKDEIEEIRKLCAPRKIITLMDAADQSYCDCMEGEVYQFFEYVFHVQKEWVNPWTVTCGKTINKLSFMYRADEDYTYLLEHLKEKFEVAKHIRYPFADATPRGADKGSGILTMLDYLDLPVEASYGFCDGDNDVPLVKTVGTAVIMGRHYEGLEPYAALTTDLVKNDGIQKGLQRIGLI